MSICLCLDSAEKVLNLISFKAIKTFGVYDTSALRDCRATADETRRLDHLPASLHVPVSLLVPAQELRTHRKGCKAHVWSGKVPEGSLIDVGNGIFVASPEFNAALEMRGRPLVSRALMLMMYCGIFAIDEGSEDGFIRRPQLTGIDDLQRFSRLIKRESCSDKLREALALVGKKCRSPLEARLLLALTAPTALGGLGLEMPCMNHPITLGREGRAIWGSGYLEGDMVWRDVKTALEAQGSLRHEGRFGDDLTRASAMESEGYAVRFATSQQVKSARQMLLLGRWLAGNLGVDAGRFPERDKVQRLLNAINSFRYHHISLDELRTVKR